LNSDDQGGLDEVATQEDGAAKYEEFHTSRQIDCDALADYLSR
jgi:hypothetical protein